MPCLELSSEHVYGIPRGYGENKNILPLSVLKKIYPLSESLWVSESSGLGIFVMYSRTRAFRYPMPEKSIRGDIPPRRVGG